MSKRLDKTTGFHRQGIAQRFGRARSPIPAIVLLLTTGCPPVIPPVPDEPSDFVDGNTDDSVTSPLGKTTGEPNDSFDFPIVAVFDSSGLAKLKGTVESQNDLDVYLLGDLEAGDRVIIDAFAAGSATLDASIALFDDARKLVSENDDRTESNLDSRIDVIIRHGGDPYYLVVTRSAFASSRKKSGAYTVDVQIIKGNTVPPPVGQILLLDFDGGPVDSPVLGRMTLPPFDARDIDPIYAGQTDVIKGTIREVMEQNYERFDVTILTTDDPLPGAGEKFTTIFFGGFNDAAFGIAENVDLYNADRCDDAIIFTESFTPTVFSFDPTAAEMGLAIGNVAAHEAGHVLGLNHVDDDLDLMDDRSAADAFLFDQEFKNSPLSSDIMPIGTQDSEMLLEEIVGLVAAGPAKPIWIPRVSLRVNSESPGGAVVVRRLSPKQGSR